jgi:hypothetical protein
LNRRTFLAGAIATAAAGSSVSFAAETQAELKISRNAAAAKIPETYAGLSYELAELTNAELFSRSNHDLVAYFRLLAPKGVLRLGGNSSEFCWFRADASTPAPKLHVPPGDLNANWMPHRLFAIEPRAIDELAGFLDATGWRLIYGLNFGNSTPERAAAEAAYVAEKIGSRIEFFQIGNEPDLYRTATNGTRPPGWDFPDYLREWTAYAEAIAARVPGARFAGPDVAGASDWVTRFGEQEPGKLESDRLPGKIVALTGHYYAEGPPDSLQVTIERLLRPNQAIAETMRRIEVVVRPRGLVYRMSEGNSCYRGGKPGMSNALASALWAGSYMLELASLGCAGVNFHGGTEGKLTASLGDHTPGLDSAKTPQTQRGGFYTPIRSEPGQPAKAMPIFHGILLANQLSGGTLLDADLKAAGVNATAFATEHEGQVRVAVFNKDAAQALDLAVHAPGRVKSAKAWRLEGPALDATEGITLAGAAVSGGAQWSPKTVERLATHGDSARIHLPAGSAALLFLETTPA